MLLQSAKLAAVFQVKGESGEIDVVPYRATYSSKGFQSDPPKNPFLTNDKAMHAVRDVKIKCQEQGKKVRGYHAEQAAVSMVSMGFTLGFK